MVSTRPIWLSSCAFLSFLTASISLFALAFTTPSYTTVPAQINRGGDCQIICKEVIMGCGVSGTINISFSPPEFDVQYALIEAPLFCNEEITTSETICCQKYIDDDLLIWAEIISSDSGNWTVKKVTQEFNPSANFYLLLASLFLITCLVFLIFAIISCRNYRSDVLNSQRSESIPLI